jgi:GT2 family glycosyltransferase
MVSFGLIGPSFGKGLPVVRLTALIANWNRREELAALLADLRQQTLPPEEVIVVDDGSTDGAPQMVRERFPEVRLIALEQNQGFNHARNVGIQAATGEIIASLDNDLRLLDPSFLEKLRRSFAAHPDCAALSFGVIDGVWRPEQIPPGAMVLPFSTLAAMAAAGQAPLPTHFRYDWFIRMGAAALRRTLFERVGLLDASFRYGGEEWDLAFRCHAAGLRLGCDTGLWVVHTRSPAMRSPAVSDLILRNMVVALARFLPLPDLLAFLIVQGAVSSVRGLRQRRLGSTLRVFTDIARYWPRDIAPKRRPVPSAVLRRYYALRMRNLTDFRQVEAARENVLSFYCTQLTRHGRQRSEPRVVAAMQPEAFPAPLAAS